MFCRGTHVTEKKIAIAKLQAKARVLWRQMLRSDASNEQEVRAQQQQHLRNERIRAMSS
jgi:hypothetical protein